MNKKLYKRPAVTVANLKLTNMICGSGGDEDTIGSGTTGNGEHPTIVTDKIWGD